LPYAHIVQKGKHCLTGVSLLFHSKLGFEWLHHHYGICR